MVRRKDAIDYLNDTAIQLGKFADRLGNQPFEQLHIDEALLLGLLLITLASSTTVLAASLIPPSEQQHMNEELN